MSSRAKESKVKAIGRVAGKGRKRDMRREAADGVAEEKRREEMR